MTHKNQSELLNNEFTLPCKATQDTVWVIDPANPTEHETGPIRRGETIWVHHELFGSGPTWEPARLKNNRHCFVQPHHFVLKVPPTGPPHSVSL